MEECGTRSDTACLQSDTLGQKRPREPSTNEKSAAAKKKKATDSVEKTGDIRLTLTAADVRQAMAFHGISWLMDDGMPPSSTHSS